MSKPHPQALRRRRSRETALPRPLGKREPSNKMVRHCVSAYLRQVARDGADEDWTPHTGE